jgi:hypothetical protein
MSDLHGKTGVSQRYPCQACVVGLYAAGWETVKRLP